MNKWEKEVMQHQLTAEQAVIKELEAQYKRALHEINLKIRILKGDDLTQSKIYQINYQEALKGQIEGILEKLHGDEFTSIQEYLKECYTDGFIGTMYDIAGQGIPLMIPIDQNAAVKAIMTDSKINEGLYKAIGVDTAELKKRIRSEITRGLAANDTYESIAQSISLYTNAPLARARTIVRTEGHRIQQASTEDARQAAKKRGCDVLKVWDATLDGKTRTAHRKMDGQIRETDEFFEMDGKKAKYPGEFGRPEEDCNCRCTANSIPRWALDEAELEEQKERAKFFGIDKTKDFEEYKKKYLKAAEESAKNEEPKVSFNPAKTIEEAEEYAKENFVVKKTWTGNGNVSYKGLSLDMANEFNSTFTELYEEYDLPKLTNIQPMNFRANIWKGSETTPMAYRNISNGELYFNPKILKDEKALAAYIRKGKEAYDKVTSNAGMFTGAKRELVEKYIKAGRQLVAEDAHDTAKAILCHEMGHHIQNRIINYSKELFEIAQKGFDEYSLKISGYAAGSIGEYIAESFSAYKNGESGIIDPKLLGVFERLIK